MKREEITFKITFCPDKHLCSLAGGRKIPSHEVDCENWVPYLTSYLILFATIITVRHYSYYSDSKLFQAIRTIRHSPRYSLFATIRCSRLFRFTIRVFHRFPRHSRQYFKPQKFNSETSGSTKIFHLLRV